VHAWLTALEQQRVTRAAGLSARSIAQVGASAPTWTVSMSSTRSGSVLATRRDNSLSGSKHGRGADLWF
jgi:hypothetical protein